MIKQRSEKIDVIIGIRKKRLDGFLRLLTSRMLSLLIFFFKGVYLHDSNTPYRIFKYNSLKKVLDIIKINKNYSNIELKNVLISYLSKKEKLKIKWINITFRKRYNGESKYNFIKMLKLILNFFRYI